MTHVALVCNDTLLQPRLPQVLLVAEKILPQKEARDIIPHLPPNIHLWRRKSGWVNIINFIKIVELLAAVLDEHAPGRPRILLMDALPIHCCSEVLDAARQLRVRVVIIPACCTNFLQPLDTHVFSQYKKRIRRLQQECMLDGANEDLSSRLVVDCVGKAVRAIFQGKKWAKAFHANGFGGRKFQPSLKLLWKLGLEEAPTLACRLPSYEDFLRFFLDASTSTS